MVLVLVFGRLPVASYRHFQPLALVKPQLVYGGYVQRHILFGNQFPRHLLFSLHFLSGSLGGSNLRLISSDRGVPLISFLSKTLVYSLQPSLLISLRLK